MNPFQNERYELRERIHRARSSDEARYYEEKLWRLEPEMMQMPDRHYFAAPQIQPIVNEADLEKIKIEIETQTPLSFLKTADKKLLLTGATS